MLEIIRLTENYQPVFITPDSNDSNALKMKLVFFFFIFIASPLEVDTNRLTDPTEHL